MSEIVERRGEQGTEPALRVPLGVAMDRYLTALGRSGLVDSVIAGFHEERSTVHFYQVLAKGVQVPVENSGSQPALIAAQKELLRAAGDDALTGFTNIAQTDLPRLQEGWRVEGVVASPINISEHRFFERVLRRS